MLAQQEVEQKSNEMTAVPLLLEMLDLKGCIVTADALNSQKTIAAKVKVIERGGDYVLALKANHLHLFEDVRDYFAWCRGQPGGLAHLSDDSDKSRETKAVIGIMAAMRSGAVSVCEPRQRTGLKPYETGRGCKQGLQAGAAKCGHDRAGAE